MTNRFNDDLLANFAQNFYGYGNYKGPYWFIGMEEAGGDFFEEVEKRLVAWDRRGRRELEDVASFHEEIGHGKLFQKSPPVQRTWNKLIRIILSANGHEVNLEMVREYQRDYLGRLDRQSCLIELFPLPSPSIAHWMYAEHSALLHLATKETYQEYYVNQRIAHIQSRIEQYQPKAVIFYSSMFQAWWQKIVGKCCVFEEINGISVARKDGTIFVITKHPVTRGITNNYFHNVGRMIASDWKVSKFLK